MTRLKTSDIEHIATTLDSHDAYLMARTGFGLSGIAACACGVAPPDHAGFLEKYRAFRIAVVPVTSGLGVISTFSESVCAIVTHMGFQAEVTDATDTSGVAEAFEKGVDAVMMADDDRFVGLNLSNRKVTDNSEATGRAFATALTLMAKAKGHEDKTALVMGCGPVGSSAAETLLNAGVRVALYDVNPIAAGQLHGRLTHRFGKKIIGSGSIPFVTMEDDFDRALQKHNFILEATPVADTLPASLVTPETYVSSPGIPLGINKEALEIITEKHLIHDTLELGVAVMAASLLI